MKNSFDYNKILINKNCIIEDCIKKLNETGKKCLIVINNKGNLYGTISDGDIRKSLLKNHDIKSSVSKIINKNPYFINDKEQKFSSLKKIFVEKNYDLIPIIDSKKKIVDVIFFHDLVKKTENSIEKKNFNTPVFIFAGGKGTRLDPITKIIPKPLVPIKNIPWIDHIISRYEKNGYNNFTISINYKSNLLKAYFKENYRKKNLKLITEKDPLGTAGSLQYFKTKSENFFVSNCDIILNTDYEQILKEKSQITVVASSKIFELPYGSCIIDKKLHLKKIIEKPKLNFLVNTGFYILNKNILKLIPKNKPYNMNELINAAKNNNKKVSVYPVSDDEWLDVGQWDEYIQNIEKIL